MTHALRIILFVLEFVLYTFIAILLTYKKHKKKEKIAGTVACFIGGVIIAILLFFSFPEFIFLSYKKIIVIGIMLLTIIMMQIGIMIMEHYHNIIGLILMIISIIALIPFAYATQGYINFGDNVSEKTITSKVTPMINGKEGIGNVVDDEGYIQGFTFSYVEKDKLCNVYLNHDEAVNTKIDVDDKLLTPYVIKNTKITTITNEERKVKTTTIESYTYEIHVSSSQMVHLLKR